MGMPREDILQEIDVADVNDLTFDRWLQLVSYAMIAAGISMLEREVEGVRYTCDYSFHHIKKLFKPRTTEKTRQDGMRDMQKAIRFLLGVPQDGITKFSDI